MELRFVVTERPLRPIPTRADSGVDLYPAATTFDAGVPFGALPYSASEMVEYCTMRCEPVAVYFSTSVSVFNSMMR
jgi:hypothetical protein